MDPRVFMEAGLLKRRETDGGSYDAFRNRLMFPIHDRLGRVIAFGGRRINDEDEPKYINSPESRLFDKSATLYALPLASRAIQESRTAIITEGYTDVIACHQGGFRNAVATLGTALTPKHASLLRGLCERVLLLFDGDDAGQRAADRAASVFFSEPLDVAIVTLDKHTDAKDPDELLKREGGSEVFARALAGAVDLLEYRFARIRERLQGGGMAAMSRAIDEEIQALVALGLRDVPPIRQRLIVQRLGELAGVDDATVQRAIPAGRAGPKPSSPRAEIDLAAVPTIPLRLSSAGHLLGAILCDGSLHAALSVEDRGLIDSQQFKEPGLRVIAEAISSLVAEGLTPSLNTLLANTEDENLRQAAVNLSSRIDRETDRNPDQLATHFRECLRRTKLDRPAARSPRPPVGSPDLQEPKPTDNGDVNDVMARIAQARSKHQTLGPDRRQLPRPS
jgi:DNA primase